MKRSAITRDGNEPYNARVRAAMSIDQLAKASGVSRSAIVRAEARGSWPRSKALTAALRDTLTKHTINLTP